MVALFFSYHPDCVRPRIAWVAALPSQPFGKNKTAQPDFLLPLVLRTRSFTLSAASLYAPIRLLRQFAPSASIRRSRRCHSLSGFSAASKSCSTLVLQPLTIICHRDVDTVRKMSTANISKIEDAEKQNLYAACNTPASQSSSVQKPLTDEAAEPSTTKMSRFPRFLFTILFVAVLGLTLVSATANSVTRVSISATDKQRFRQLLNTVDPVSLHNVLHDNVKDKYQHGVYQEDKKAMEVVHQENAEAAYSLVELARRQTSNATVTTSETTVVIVESTITLASSTQAPPSTSQTSEAPPSSSPVVPTTQSSVAPTVQSTTPEQSPTTQAPTTAQTTPPAVVQTSTSTTQTQTPSSTTPASTAQNPTTPIVAPTTSPGQSSNGTYYGGPAAYPFAPVPIPLPPPAASYVKNNSSGTPTVTPSLAPYVLQNVSNSSSSPVPSSFTYAPPFLTSIPTVTNKTVAYAAPLSAYAAPIPLPPPGPYILLSFSVVPNTSYAPSLPLPVPSPVPYVSIQNLTIVYNTSSATSLPPITLPFSYKPMPTEPAIHTTVRSNSSANVPSSILYIPAESSMPVYNPPTPAYSSPMPVYSSPYVSEICTSTIANVSTSALASVSPSGYPFNGYISGASPTSSPAVPSSSPAAPSSSSDVPAGPASTQGKTSSNVPAVASPSTMATTTSPSGQTSAGGDNPATPSSTSSIHSITQQTVYTTTLSNGDVKTVTSITVVAGVADQTGPGGSASKTSAAKGSLQTNGARSVKNMGMNGILGALGMVVAGVL